LALFAEAAEAVPEDPWPLHGRGDALLESGDSGGALSAYEAALDLGEDSLSHLGRGNCLERLGRLEEARGAFESALGLDPQLAWAREGLERCDGLNAGEE
jgi:Flp pilus assembly protein TadD